jgi:hypothetical protein
MNLHGVVTVKSGDKSAHHVLEENATKTRLRLIRTWKERYKLGTRTIRTCYLHHKYLLLAPVAL